MDSQVNRMQKLSDEKRKIMNKLATSQELCKALFYNTSDFLDQPDIDPYSLFDGDTQRIYPYKFVPDATNDQNSYITMEFGNYGLVRNAYKDGYIYIYTLVFKGNEDTDNGWTRSDYLIHLVDQQVNQMRGIGVGRLQFYDSKSFRLNDSYYGKCNVYKFYGFN